jgi:hypothetical protein
VGNSSGRLSQRAQIWWLARGWQRFFTLLLLVIRSARPTLVEVPLAELSFSASRDGSVGINPH